jgi:hypothetical protein
MTSVLQDVARLREEKTLEELEDTLRFEDQSKPRVFMVLGNSVFELPLHKTPKNTMSLARLCMTFQASRAMAYDGHRTLYASRPQTGGPAAVLN